MKRYLEFINEGKVINFKNKAGNFIVLMGGPGSGKSTISKNLINLRNSKIFNVDDEREKMAKILGLNLNNPEDNKEIIKITHSSTDPRNRTVNSLKTLLKNSESSKELPNIIFDTVGTHIDLIKELIEIAKGKGYSTTMIYAKCDVDVALDRNRKRERKLHDDVVVDYHGRLDKSFKILSPLYDNVWTVDNKNFSIVYKN